MSLWLKPITKQMAFRPTSNLIEGMLDNTAPGRVEGWIDFFRKGKRPLHCVLDLDGDFHDDIRGRILHIWNKHPTDAGFDGSLGRIEPGYMDRMHPLQTGKAGDFTTQRHVEAYIDWYSNQNGRVALSIPPRQFEILGAEVDLSKLPPRKTHPDLFETYLRNLGIAFRKATKDPKATVLGLGPKGIRTGDEPGRN
jgi:hypothetical protein